MVVLVDKSHAMAALSSMWLVWLFTGAAFLIAIIAALIIASGLLRPITQIEDGLLRIMNGDWTHRFDVQSAELGGLSYRINQLMAALLGDEEEGEAMDAEGGGAPADPREAYYQQLFEKFQAAQKQIKQDPNAVSFADFRARLVDNEKKILEKNPGKQVEFEIVVQGNQITFKPIIK
jgi:HAMP domain-containing protein